MSKALVVLSGGQSSFTCLCWALREYDQVAAITFNYGQNHSVEVDCARRICRRFKVRHNIIDLDFMDKISDSALINGGNVSAVGKNGLPASFVPNRNAIFLTLAHAFAQKIGARDVVAGMCETDFSGYPDCRHAFIENMEYSLNMGSDTHIFIVTPLMFLTKAQTFKMADDLGRLTEVIELSHTCYKGDRSKLHSWGYGCGKCPACVLRKNGYEEFITML